MAATTCLLYLRVPKLGTLCDSNRPQSHGSRSARRTPLRHATRRAAGTRTERFLAPTSVHVIRVAVITTGASVRLAVVVLMTP